MLQFGFLSPQRNFPNEGEQKNSKARRIHTGSPAPLTKIRKPHPQHHMSHDYYYFFRPPNSPQFIIPPPRPSKRKGHLQGLSLQQHFLTEGFFLGLLILTTSFCCCRRARFSCFVRSTMVVMALNIYGWNIRGEGNWNNQGFFSAQSPSHPILKHRTPPNQLCLYLFNVEVLLSAGFKKPHSHLLTEPPGISCLYLLP